MTSINYVKKILADELNWRTTMSDAEIQRIVNSFIKNLDNKRLILAPTFLSDKMYDAQKTYIPDMQYEVASQLYKNAIDELRKNDDVAFNNELTEDR